MTVGAPSLHFFCKGGTRCCRRDVVRNPQGAVRDPITPPGGWPSLRFRLPIPRHDCGCPILAFFARACPELAEGVGRDASGATLSETLKARSVIRSLRRPPFAKSTRRMGHPLFRSRGPMLPGRRTEECVRPYVGILLARRAGSLRQAQGRLSTAPSHSLRLRSE
jgi:hypothetical protein